MANNNQANARNAANKGGSGRNVFYGVLVAVVVLGIGALLYATKHASSSTTDSSALYNALQKNYANAGPPQPHTLGNANAPVIIEEFADFECPVCGSFATVTEPDVRKQLVETGKAYYKYYDFPLPQHKNTQAASNAAACAEEQGKFWEMHDKLFSGQDAWGLTATEGEVVDNPKSVFMGYAKDIGLNTTQWEKCYDTRKFQPRINANLAEGFKRQVNSTPTFYVNGTVMQTAATFDALSKAVDAATAAKK